MTTKTDILFVLLTFRKTVSYLGRVLRHTAELVRVLQCIIWLFHNFLGTQVNFSDPISIRMPSENCFAVPNQKLLLVYGGSGAPRNALHSLRH